MTISIFDLFKIGIGPSSSHTIGPMIAAKKYSNHLKSLAVLNKTHHITIELYGSLAFTGKGHGTADALMLGLAQYEPDTVSPSEISSIIKHIIEHNQIKIINHKIKFNYEEHIIFNIKKNLPKYSNGMLFTAYDKHSNKINEEILYSIGGGFLISDNPEIDINTTISNVSLPYDFDTASELLEHCKSQNDTIAQIVMQNECCWHDEEEVYQKANLIWYTMNESIERGCSTTGVLPGGLDVPRRAHDLNNRLQNKSFSTEFMNIYAMAVNEENAAGGRVVTAPTNGSAGIIPAVFKYYQIETGDTSDKSIAEYLFTAGAIGVLFKKGASISGAEMGCMGEVGVACAMAAGGYAALKGGSPAYVEKAAEIAIEHHLGLTCDPVNGLVQIPCIERNAMGAVKAVNAANIALNESERHKVSLDKAIATMKATGQDMNTHYKETSLGGLAVNVPEC